MKRTRYVMLVEKQNGRIIKNEQYTLDEFIKQVGRPRIMEPKIGVKIVNFPNRFKYLFMNVTNINKALNNRVHEIANIMFKRGQAHKLDTVRYHIDRLIDRDVDGKGSPAKKVGRPVKKKLGRPKKK